MAFAIEIEQSLFDLSFILSEPTSDIRKYPSNGTGGRLIPTSLSLLRLFG